MDHAIQGRRASLRSALAPGFHISRLWRCVTLNLQSLWRGYILSAFGAGTFCEPWRWYIFRALALADPIDFDSKPIQLNLKRDRARELSVDVERDAMRARIEQSSERQNELRCVCIFTSLVSGSVEDRAHVAAVQSSAINR